MDDDVCIGDWFGEVVNVDFDCDFVYVFGFMIVC